MNPYDYFEVALGVLAGISLLILGVEQMSEGFESLAEERARKLIDRFTTNPVMGVLTGAVACTVLDSSSVTIIMVIAMVEARAMTFPQALGVVMGANIGTTIGAKVIALGVTQFGPLLMLAGLLMKFLAKGKRVKQVGACLLGVGLLFFALESLDATLEPLAQTPAWQEWIERFGETPVLGALCGALVTVVIQSSSATVGIVVKLAESGAVTAAAGVAIMLGAEIGTVSNTLVATAGRSREAVRTGVFHFVFNAASVVCGLLFIGPLISLAERLPGEGAQNVIANAQIAFNVIGVAITLCLLPVIAPALMRLIPPKTTKSEGPDGRP
ncbi:MAG: Na/Pi symporter [Planctomycetota bacterium]